MANTIETSPQSKVIFTFQGPSGLNSPAGIAGAVQFTPEGLPNGSGQKSDVYDLGGGPRVNLFEWRAKTVVGGGAPTLGATVEMYLVTSDDGTLFDANLASGNLLTSNAEKRRNLQYLGAIQVDQAATGLPFITSGLTQIYARYACVAWWNLTGQSLSATQGDNLFQLTPVPDQVESF